MERLNSPCRLCLLHRFIRSMHKLHHVTVLLLVLHVVGCNPSPTPTPGPTPDQPKIINVRAVAYQDEQPILAHAIAQVTRSNNPSPGPSPTPSPDGKPKVGDTCPNCDGRGKSGDGISPCKPCGGDGTIHEKDLLNWEAAPEAAEPEAEVEHVAKEDFEKLQESVVASLHELNKHLKDLEDRANKAFDQTQDGIEKNEARINELEASVRALELNLRNHTLDHPAAGKLKPALPLQEKTPLGKSTKPKYEYAIQYEGAWYYWSERDKHFLNLTTLQSIPFPTLTDISARLGTELQVCNGTQCKMCRIVKVAQ